VSAVATPQRAATRPHDEPARTFSDRLLSAVPLLSIYLWLCIVYAVEAIGHVTPWLFGDELEFTQLSRAIADTGHPARRGAAHGASLYAYLVAPAWWLHSTPAAYTAIKYIGILVMASALFPAYFLARMVVGKWAALFAATAVAAVPALAYSSWIVQEPLAYAYAALGFLVIAKALATRSRWWIGAAVVVCAVAPAVRGELAVLPATALLAIFFMAWSGERWRTRRKSWSIGDWAGAVTLGFGAIFLFSGVMSHQSQEWYSVTTYWKDRVLDLGLWAVGAFAIGIGVVPLIAGLATLWRMPGEVRSRELRVFRSVALGGLISFGIYTCIKAAYLSTVFATRVEERNVIYVAPLLFVGTALWLEGRRVNLLALGAATAFAVYLVVGTPYFMDRQLYSDALGLAILQQGNRFLYWTPTFAHWLLLTITIVGAGALAVPRFVGGRRGVAVAVAAVLGLLVVGWNLTGEIAAAAGTNSISREAGVTLGKPFDWVDRLTHRKPTLYLGQGVADQNPQWMLEFWNRSILSVGSIDGTVGGPGPAGGPNFLEDGTTYWTPAPDIAGPVYDYAVEEWPCVDFAGRLVEKHFYRAGGRPGGGRWRLIELTHPNRLQAMCVGLSPDGWTGPSDSSYFRFSGPKHGKVVVTISRAEWGGASVLSPVHVLVGTLRIDENHQPRFDRMTSQKTITIDRLERKTVTVEAPGPRFAVHVVVDKKFVPNELDPNLSDRRQLGAVVSYRFEAATK
jgi:uncharacterized membrane protein